MQKIFITGFFLSFTAIAFAQSPKATSNTTTSKTTPTEMPSMESKETTSVSRGASNTQATMATMYQKSIQKLHQSISFIPEEDDTHVFPSESAEDRGF